MAFLKAVVLGAFLTWIVALFVGSSGSSGGFLNIFRMPIGDFSVLWSWPLFLASTGLCWGILLLME